MQSNYGGKYLTHIGTLVWDFQAACFLRSFKNCWGGRLIGRPSPVKSGPFFSVVFNLTVCLRAYVRLKSKIFLFCLTTAQNRPKVLAQPHVLICRFHKALIKKLDFHTSPETSRNKINNYVARKTREDVPNIMEENSVNQNTKLVLVNTIYLEVRTLTTERTFSRHAIRGLSARPKFSSTFRYPKGKKGHSFYLLHEF